MGSGSPRQALSWHLIRSSDNLLTRIDEVNVERHESIGPNSHPNHEMKLMDNEILIEGVNGLLAQLKLSLRSMIKQLWARKYGYGHGFKYGYKYGYETRYL